jgi:hypothetical protein
MTFTSGRQRDSIANHEGRLALTRGSLPVKPPPRASLTRGPLPVKPPPRASLTRGPLPGAG